MSYTGFTNPWLANYQGPQRNPFESQENALRSMQLRQQMDALKGPAWSSFGFDPGNAFGQTYEGPGGQMFRLTPQMQQQHQARMMANDPMMGYLAPGLKQVNIGGPGGFKIDKTGGNLRMSGSMSGLFGGAGAGDLGGGAPEWNYNAPEAWGGYQFDENSIDPTQAMKAWEPWAEEQRETGFAEAAARQGPGATGFAASTPYSQALGGVARRSAEDLGRIGADYMFKASTANAQNQLQRQLAEQQASLGAWQQGGQWGHEAGMGQNQFNLGRWQTGANLDLAQQQMQQQFMQMLMSQFM